MSFCFSSTLTLAPLCVALAVVLMATAVFTLQPSRSNSTEETVSVSAYAWCPVYHLIKGTNVYDPSGPIYYDNKWHVFEDSCEWCHWVSEDMLHWTQLPSTGFQSGLTGSITSVSVSATKNMNADRKPDQEDHEDHEDHEEDQDLTFVAFYPNSAQSAILKAVSVSSNDPLLVNWTTNARAPFITKPDASVKDYRDPSRPLYIQGHGLYLGVGSGVAPSGPGMIDWYAVDEEFAPGAYTYLGSLLNVSHTNGCVDPNTIVYDPEVRQLVPAIECPDVFALDTKYVIMVSLFCTNEYFVGDMHVDSVDGTVRFSATYNSLLDYGNFYAGKTGTIAYGVNDESRRILFGFTGWHDSIDGKCGRIHVIPREISLNNGNGLNLRPISEIANIRRVIIDDDADRKGKKMGSKKNTTHWELAAIGSELQIMVECNLIAAELPTTGSLFVNVLVGDGGANNNNNSEYTQIGYNFERQVFFVDQRNCCSDDNSIYQIAPFPSAHVLKENGLAFNILLDRSLIESYFNAQRIITTLVMPSEFPSPSQRGISFSNPFASAFECSIQTWQLQL